MAFEYSVKPKMIVMCRKCGSAAESVEMEADSMNRCLSVRITCHGMGHEFSIAYEFILDSYPGDIERAVQRKFNLAVGRPMALGRTGVVELCGAPQKPKRKIDLE